MTPDGPGSHHTRKLSRALKGPILKGRQEGLSKPFTAVERLASTRVRDLTTSVLSTAGRTARLNWRCGRTGFF